MAKDNGLLVGRFNTGLPALITDNELRELRLDDTGRLVSRLSDGNDKTLSYFLDGEATGNGIGDVLGNGGDRGILVLGKNDEDSNYQVLRVNPDGSLVVSFQSGTDVSSHSDANDVAFAATDSNGEIPLTVGNWVLVKEIAVAASLTAHITGFSYCSDKNTIIQLCMIDAATSTRADVIEILDTQMTTSARPSEHVAFPRSKDRAGGTNVKFAIFAKQLQAGGAGVAWGSIDMHTTT